VEGAQGVENPTELPHFPAGPNAAPTGDFQVVLDGRALFFFASEELIARPRDHFLCRWWVNGEPVVPAGEKRGSSWGGKVITTTLLEGTLRFVGERFNARRGDRIEVQFLYAPACWRFADGSEMAVALAREGTPRVLISNRIAFTYEGD
jgi:hypothetical protein